MAYRDELLAAQARIAALERELAEERQQRREIEEALVVGARSDLAPVASSSPSTALTAASRRLGPVHYHPPRTFFPLLRVYRALLTAAFAGAPRAQRPTSDRVITLLGYYLVVVPLVYGIWLPLYVLSLCILLPWMGVVSALASVVMLPIVLLSRFRFSSAPATDETGWFYGDASPESAATLFALVCTITIPLLPLMLVCISLVEPIEVKRGALRS